MLPSQSHVERANQNAAGPGRMLRENGLRVPASHVNNLYLPELLNVKAEQLIRDSHPEKPFFLYFATPLPHSGNLTHMQTMPQYDLRPSVRTFPSKYLKRKQQLGNSMKKTDPYQIWYLSSCNQNLSWNFLYEFSKTQFLDRTKITLNYILN